MNLVLDAGCIFIFFKFVVLTYTMFAVCVADWPWVIRISSVGAPYIINATAKMNSHMHYVAQAVRIVLCRGLPTVKLKQFFSAH
jgi:hypothetical protein